MTEPRTTGPGGVADEEASPVPGRKRIDIFGRRMPLPQSRFWRITLGIALVIGGIFSFLPVLGIWMLPLGLIVLSVDLPFVRRWRRRSEVRWGRWRARRAARKAGIDLATMPRPRRGAPAARSASLAGKPIDS